MHYYMWYAIYSVSVWTTYWCRRKLCLPGKSVRGTHFSRKFCPTGQDVLLLSTLGQIVRVWFLTNSTIKGTDDGLTIYIILAIVIPITKQQHHCFPFLVVHDE